MDAFVAQHLHGVSRTYALVVPMLPKPLDESVGLAYLLMRIVDTLEDATQLSSDERVQNLNRLDAALAGDADAAEALAQPIGELETERALQRQTPEVVRRVRALDSVDSDAIITCATAMGAGVRTLIERSALRNQAYPAVRNLVELREYCYYVAGTVGEMLCTMMAHHLRRPDFAKQRQRAVELGTGLQLVNILKDARSDARQGRRYLPVIVAGEQQAAVYESALHEARDCLRRGIDYVLALPPDAPQLRAFCGLPIAWGAMTLGRAAVDPQAAKIDREAIHTSIATFAELAADDAALRDWLSELLESPQTVTDC